MEDVIKWGRKAVCGMREDVFQQFTGVVEFLGRTLGPDYEVTLYDIEPSPPELVAIANGRVSGQLMEGTLTAALDMLLCGDSAGDSAANFTSRLSNGGTVRSSVMLLRGNDGEPVGLLGISFDDTRFQAICGALVRAIHPEPYISEYWGGTFAGARDGTESMHNEVSSLIRDIFKDAASPWQVPPDRLNSDERLELIGRLEERGIFRLKGSIQYVADELGCSHASVYRYLSRVRAKTGRGRKG